MTVTARHLPADDHRLACLQMQGAAAPHPISTQFAFKHQTPGRMVRDPQHAVGDQRDLTDLNDIVERLCIQDAEEQAVSDG